MRPFLTKQARSSKPTMDEKLDKLEQKLAEVKQLYKQNYGKEVDENDEMFSGDFTYDSDGTLWIKSTTTGIELLNCFQSIVRAWLVSSCLLLRGADITWFRLFSTDFHHSAWIGFTMLPWDLQVRCIHFRQNMPSERCWKRLGALGRELGILKRLKRLKTTDTTDTTRQFISEFISESQVKDLYQKRAGPGSHDLFWVQSLCQRFISNVTWSYRAICELALVSGFGNKADEAQPSQSSWSDKDVADTSFC